MTISHVRVDTCAERSIETHCILHSLASQFVIYDLVFIVRLAHACEDGRD